VYFDFPSSDRGSKSSLNAEYVVIRNGDNVSHSVSGWTVRDKAGHVYKRSNSAASNWDGLRIAVGGELTGRMVQVFGTGDHLLIFYRHHLVRELTMDRSRSYQRLAEPGAATATATSCNWSCKPNRSDRAARQLGQAQSCPLLPVGRRGSRVKGGRRPSHSDRDNDP